MHGRRLRMARDARVLHPHAEVGLLRATCAIRRDAALRLVGEDSLGRREEGSLGASDAACASAHLSSSSSSARLRAASISRHFGVSSDELVAEPTGDAPIEGGLSYCRRGCLPRTEGEPAPVVSGSVTTLACSLLAIVGVASAIAVLERSWRWMGSRNR